MWTWTLFSQGGHRVGPRPYPGAYLRRPKSSASNMQEWGRFSGWGGHFKHCQSHRRHQIRGTSCEPGPPFLTYVQFRPINNDICRHPIRNEPIFIKMRLKKGSFEWPRCPLGHLTSDCCNGESPDYFTSLCSHGPTFQQPCGLSIAPIRANCCHKMSGVQHSAVTTKLGD